MDTEHWKKDSEHLHKCIAEFERLKKEVLESEDRIPLQQRVRDALYLDGVLAVLTTRKD